jgi:hypothetical protein
LLFGDEEVEFVVFDGDDDVVELGYEILFFMLVLLVLLEILFVGLEN